MPLKTTRGRSIDAYKIDYVLRGKMVAALKKTLLQNGEEVLLEYSDEEVVKEMNKATIFPFKESVEH